jgi:hypothetical protein
MKRTFALIFATVMILGLSVSAEATLFVRGTDSLGNQLIYDSDLNITWYDYSHVGPASWEDQVNWANNLTVVLNGNNVTGWRLPSTVDAPQSGVNWYDGTGTYGYNITRPDDEMSYLYYVELQNKGFWDTSGYWPQSGWGLNNTCPFQHLSAWYYWYGTQYLNTNMSWVFNFNNGYQGAGMQYESSLYGIAVRPGDVASVPEPSTFFLLGAGLAGVGLFRRRFKK